MSDTRTCKKCGETKPINRYTKRVKEQGWVCYRLTCKDCDNASRRLRYANDPEYRRRLAEEKMGYRLKNLTIIKQQFKVKYHNNRSHFLEKNRKSRDANRDEFNRKCREYRANNREHILNREKSARLKMSPEKKAQRYESHRNWLDANRDRLRQRARKRYATEPVVKIRLNLRNRINIAIRYGGKERQREPLKKLLGCTIEELKTQFESQFTEGMTWERFMSGEIHIDHIKPCASFDLTKVSEQRKCFHHTNLQPLWAEDNLRKNDKLDYQPLGIAA